MGARAKNDAFDLVDYPDSDGKPMAESDRHRDETNALIDMLRRRYREDLGDKKAVAERLGIAEYFVIDLEGDYLDPPLRGWRLGPEGYVPLETRGDGSLRAETLGLDIALDRMRIVLRDARTGEAILRPENLESESLLRTKRAAVLAVLSARSLAPSAAERARIETCTDASLLDLWVRGAATCATVAEALGGWAVTARS